MTQLNCMVHGIRVTPLYRGPNVECDLCEREKDLAAKESYKMSNTKQRHKWADVIIAWANGEDVQFKVPNSSIWQDCTSENPGFGVIGGQWRVKPAEVWIAIHKINGIVSGTQYSSKKHAQIICGDDFNFYKIDVDNAK